MQSEADRDRGLRGGDSVAGAVCGVSACVPDQHSSGGQRGGHRAALGCESHLRRGGRAPFRDHLGYERRQRAGGDGCAGAFAGRSRHADRAASPQAAGGLVPGVLAGDLGRRAPGAGCLHIRCRHKPRHATRLQGSGDRRLGHLAQPAVQQVGDVPERHDCDRAVRVQAADRARGRARRAGVEPGGRVPCVRDRLADRPGGDPRLPGCRHCDRRRTATPGRAGAGAAVRGDRLRSRLPGHDAVLRTVLHRRLDHSVARSSGASAAVAGRVDLTRRGVARRRSGAARARGGRPRGADLAARSVGRAGLDASDDRIHLARRSDGSADPLAGAPAGLASRGAGTGRAAFFLGCAGVGHAAVRNGSVGDVQPPTGAGRAVEDRLRDSDPRQGRAAARGDRPGHRESATERPAAGDSGHGGRGDGAAAATGLRRGSARHGGRRGRRDPLEPGATTTFVRASERRCRERGARARQPGSATLRVHAGGAGLTEPGGRSRRFRAANYAGREAGTRSRRHRQLRRHPDADDSAGVPDERDRPRRLHAIGAGAVDGGDMGADLQHRPSRRHSVQRHRPRYSQAVRSAR